MSLSSGGVYNMLLGLSITFHCHYNIWGCMGSTGPFQFRWMKRYIYSSYYYHHQIGSINFTHWYSYFSMALCLRCLLHHILLPIAYTIWVHFTISLLLLLYKLNWRHWTYKMPVRYILSSVREIKHILLVIHYTIYRAVCFQFTHFP